jgi:hypothetical protein
MLRNGFRAWWLTAMLAGGFSAGCGHSNADRPFPPDPLLLSEHPVAGKSDAPPADQVVFTAPAPPSAPTPSAVAVQQKPQADQPAAVTPVSHALPPKAAAIPPEPLYSHAPDYSWLQGVLERRANGSMYLRYCDPSAEDRWGGKVGLEFDTSVAHLKDGQRLHVDGELLPESEDVPRTNWNPYPQYRIRTLHMIADSKP